MFGRRPAFNFEDIKRPFSWKLNVKRPFSWKLRNTMTVYFGMSEHAQSWHGHVSNRAISTFLQIRKCPQIKLLSFWEGRSKT